MMLAHSSRVLRSTLVFVVVAGLAGCGSFSARAAAMPATPASSSSALRTSTGAPEPTGHAGRYVTVGLGDSVPSAANCPGCVSYVNQVGTRVAERIGEKPVVNNLAVSGYTTSDVLSQLEDESVRARIADSDLVIITVGANDLAGFCAEESGCDDADIAEVRTRLTTIVEQVRTLQSASDATVIVSGYWNVEQDGEVGRQNGQSYVTASKALTRRFNTMAAGVASSQKAIYADFSTPFVGTDGNGDPTGLLVSDGDHPNAAGHARLAAAVMSTLGL